MKTRVEPAAGGLAFYSEYYPAMVASLKTAIPASGRKWDKVRKAWIIDLAHGDKLAKLVAQYYGETITLPTVKAPSTTEQRILEVHYIGATKDRGGGEQSAFGLIDNDWSVVFPEDVLRSWFEDPGRPGDERTLFGILGVHQDAAADEIKAGYRRMAKQWHPDICREPDAAEQFRRINEAYQVLADDRKRAKYLAGLMMAAGVTAKKPDYQAGYDNYRPQLRCGLIIADGTERLGRFVVSKIHAWEDITNRQGQVLVTSWPMGAKEPTEIWS